MVIGLKKDRVYCEDCIDGMKRIPDGVVDFICCDPPYGTTNNFWDKRLPMDKMWSEFKRVTKENGAIAIFSQLPFAVDVINANRKMFRYEWIWEKIMSVGFLNAGKMPLRCHENILIFYRKLPKYNPQWWYSTPYTKKQYSSQRTTYSPRGRWGKTDCEDGRRCPRDVLKPWYLAGFNAHAEHSAQKPIELLEYLIKTYTDEGELVLDACMGSGATAVACVNTGRHFIGFETHEPFVEISNRRIEEARSVLLNETGAILE